MTHQERKRPASASGRRCDHARTIERAVIGPCEFDGGSPPPSGKEDYRPVGSGYVLVVVGECPDRAREVFQVVVQRYHQSPVAGGQTIRIPGTPARTTGRPDGALDLLPDVLPATRARGGHRRRAGGPTNG